MLERTTSALWPEVPTGGVPQRMSLGCCDQADELAALSAKMTANAVNARLSMAFPSSGWRSLTDEAAIRPARVRRLWLRLKIASVTQAINQPLATLATTISEALAASGRTGHDRSI